MKIKDLFATAARRTLGVSLGLALAWQTALAPLDAAAQTAAQTAPARPAAAAQANPPLWVIRDADSTIYLFGTVHLLPEGVEWRTPAVDRALAESREVWFEIAEVGDDAAAAAAMGKLVPQLGLDPAKPLSSKLTAADRARLNTVATQLGVNPAQLEPLRPWLAALTLTITGIQKAGFDPNRGVDPLLAKAAREQGKPVRALETLEQQLRFFADMPPEVELEMLRATLDDVDGGPEMLRQLAQAWARGELPAFERLFLAEMRQEHPDLYKVLIVNRNTAWAKTIQEKLAGSGVSFMAVGAGHLVGPDSVQAKLAALGVQAERR